MARKIVITSGKGGVGKTTITAFLGAKLAEQGERVVVVDLDLGLNNLDIAMGVEDKVVYDLTDAVEGRCRAKQSMIQSEQKNLYVIPSAHTFSRQITGQNVKLLIEGLANGFDYVLLDCPAGIDNGFMRAVSVADEAIVVVVPTLASMRDADKVITVLRSYKLEQISCVVNMCRKDLIRRNRMLSPQEIESILKIPIIAEIPSDDYVLTAKNFNLPKFSCVSRCFKALSKTVKTTKRKVVNEWVKQ